MSVERLECLPQDTRVTFELQGSLPILQEEYTSPQAGKIVLKGLFNQSARIQLLDGSRYRTLSPRKIAEYPTDLVYPVVHLPDKVEVLQLRTPLRLEQGKVPRLRYVTTLADRGYVFRQISPGQRGFELWDGMEMEKLVNRESHTKLMPDLVLLSPVPVLLIMLFPWLDSQTIMYRQP
jgi:hypothetical protein